MSERKPSGDSKTNNVSDIQHIKGGSTISNPIVKDKIITKYKDLENTENKGYGKGEDNDDNENENENEEEDLDKGNNDDLEDEEEVDEDDNEIEEEEDIEEESKINSKKNGKKSVDEKKKQRRSKSFTGCYTCRRRKIACDLARPSCLKCKKSGFVCEGYDVKLRWSQPIEFDKYGYQLPSKPNQETEYSQRRSIEYVKYPDKKTYKFYDEMDTDLAKLHNKHMESKSLSTILEGHFGVFRGSKLQPKNKKKRKSSQRSKDIKRLENITDKTEPNAKRAKSSLLTKQSNLVKANNKEFTFPTRNLSNSSSTIFTNTNQYKSITKNKNFLYPQNVSNSIVSVPNQFDTNNKGNEWLSTELLDAALLTASALNGDTHFLDMFDLEGSNAISTFPAVNTNNHINDENLRNASNNINSNINNNTFNNGSQGDIFADSVPDKMLHLLFQGRNIMDVQEQHHQIQGSLPENQQQQLLQQEKHSGHHQQLPLPPQQQQLQLSQQQQQQQSLHQPSSLPQQQVKENKKKINIENKYDNQQPSLELNSAEIIKQHRTSSDTYNSSIPSMSLSARPRYNQMSPEEVVSIHSVDDDGTINSSNVDHSGSLNSSSVAQNAGIVPTTNLNNKYKGNDQPVIDNEIKIHASSTIKMPKTIMEILETKPLPKSLAIDKFGIPTTSLNVHPMARYLLNYYIEDVADMMTVIPLAKNPWKFIYFPRALMAIGELASLGKTSNARNGLLNALLAVSAFNLQSKFVRGSDEMKYYVDLGIQLRRQANEFVNRCMEEDILSQKYKDVLVAVLSMVTIDVVWGTMSSCKIHLDHCEKIIEKKMLHKKKLSSKAVILHRIFSSLKLIQDSTSLENIQKSEIFLNEKNYKNFLTGSKPTNEQIDELNKDNFRGIFRGSRVKNARNYMNNTSNVGNSANDNINGNEYNNGLSTRTSSSRPDFDNISVSSPGSYYQSKQKSSASSKRGKYNEKITDNGKVRIEFIVNNDESSLSNEQFDVNSDIPAFVDITRTSFKPSKNKLDDKVVSSDAIYGLPNSLILMFGEIVPLTRFKKYHEDHNILLPSFFDELATQLEFKLLSWKLEWTLIVEDDAGSGIGDSIDENKRTFISPRHEGIYHHVMSFYHALIIYFYRFIEDVNPMYLLERIEKVLYHLNKIQEILENNKETSYIIPLFWQGFIAGSEAMTIYLQNGFNKWGQDIAQTGIGTYWNARQIMLEIWRRKNHNVKNNSWVDVLRDWKTNVMLT